MKVKVKYFIPVTVAGLFFIGEAWTAWTACRYKQEIKNLFADHDQEVTSIYRTAQLDGLPEPVQRYFRHVLKDGQPYIQYSRLKHTGRFKTDLKKDWVEITGEQYFTAPEPGFIWIGKTAMFSARDMFLKGQGRLTVKLFSVAQIADGSGPKYDQGELLRWLGESAWFPTNLLPSDNLKWSPIDESSARLTYSFNGLEVFYIVRFNEAGEIIQMETKRYMGENNLENWIGKFSDYRQLNGVVVPTYAEGLWRLPSGDHSYAQFNVTTLEYEKAEPF